MTGMAVKNENFQLSVADIEDGKGVLTFSMKAPIHRDVTAENVFQVLEEISKTINEFRYCYSVKEAMRFALDGSKKQEEKEDSNETV